MLCLRLFLAVILAAATTHADPVTVPLTKNLFHEFINTQYAGSVDIGSQSFLLVFDTSSPNVIIPSQQCIGGSCSCVSTDKYVGSKRGNGRPITVNYFDCSSATGNIITETLTIVSLNSSNQGIILADQIDMAICTLAASGVVGLAPPPAKHSSGLETVMANFADQDSIPNVFSVHHARYPDGEHFGELILGGSDTTYISGNFTSVPLADDSSWKFKLDQVLIGETNVADDNTLGFVDTSKAIIMGPDSQIDQINNEIGCTSRRIGDNNLCELSCDDTDNLPEFAFIISGKTFNISAEYYVQRNGDICYSGFMPNGQDYYMIGDFFIDNYYSEFNWDEK
ncbi:hypothetical protein L9F63_015203 [Diploptera punctata]|uniref:Peptidase A1 domain-containing protein n=1 Tax=Diploptera punctata TaxID=6984 RepID=A0AAD8A6B0_DIPPU|nr:hypothetical protein L9F63_015203 [Diploptera punctata]